MIEKPIEKAAEEIDKERLIAVLSELTGWLQEVDQRLNRLERMYPVRLPKIKKPPTKFIFHI